MTSEEELPEITLPGIRANKKIPQRKIDYGTKLRDLLAKYTKCLVCDVTNVGSSQIAEMRKDFRGKARFLFGKNTMIRKVIRDYVKESGNKDLKNLMDLVKGNTGFCFTEGSITDLRKEIVSRKVQSPAKAGSIAPVDVWVPQGSTGMEPTQTGFFQAMNIPTRINRGQIDIVSDVQVVFQGTKVGASEASLLVKLGIKPFYYGMKVISVYDNGDAYDASVLDISDEDVAQAFFDGMRQVASLCLQIDYPTIVSVPHSTLNALKQTLSLGLAFNTYTFDKLDSIREILANPGAFAAAQGGDAKGAGDKPGGGDAPAKEPTPEKSSSAAPVDPFGAGDSSSSDSS